MGPEIDLEDFAGFEIRYADGQAVYVKSNFGTEESLSVELLPDNLSHFDYVHLVPLGNIARQQEILRECRGRGARRISAGTAMALILERPDIAKPMLEEADVLFMNDEEARYFYGDLDSASRFVLDLLGEDRGL